MFEWFKELPPEVRTMVALAGLGTPIGAVYFAQRYLFPTVPLFLIILGVAVVLALLALLAFALKNAFTDDFR